MTLEEASGEAVEVWPDNVSTVEVFMAMGTQWRSSGFGATGLDYSALPAVLRLTATPRSEWPDVFECLRVMEYKALEIMRREK